jgi:uncharacterized membrane protein
LTELNTVYDYLLLAGSLLFVLILGIVLFIVLQKSDRALSEKEDCYFGHAKHREHFNDSKPGNGFHCTLCGQDIDKYDIETIKSLNPAK